MINRNGQLNKPLSQTKGSVLIVVIWIVLVLSSLVLILAHQVRTESIAASNYIALEKAESVANGAIQYVFAMLAAEEDSTTSLESFQGRDYEAMEVGDGYFWILKPNYSGSKEYEFGLVDESSKINLNEAPVEMLLNLPGMTNELSASIVDWIDEDEEITTGGAENEYYLLEDEPYQCKNAPFETLEELLLVKGASPELLFGEDMNRNGMLDWNENDGDYAYPPDNNNGQVDPGFYNYLTIFSHQSSGDGSEELINVSSNRNRNQLTELLTEEFGEEKALDIMSSVTLREFSSITEFYYYIGMERDDFAKIQDRITVSGNNSTAGKINVNTAPEEVLMCLPELEQSDVDKLIVERSQSGTDLSSILWTTDVLDIDKSTAIGEYITTESHQYSADIIAVSADGRAYCRYYIVIDAADGQPQLVYKQTLTELGFPLDPQILQDLRDGKQI